MRGGRSTAPLPQQDPSARPDAAGLLHCAQRPDARGRRMRRRRRILSDEERALWERVQATAVPLHQAPIEPKPRPEPAKPGARPEPQAPAPMPPRAEPEIPGMPPLDRVFQRPMGRGSVSLDLRPDPLAQPLSMDKRTYTKMKRGKVLPEARIDLHGLTLAEAHADLTAFLLSSHQLGRRLVLVITGKGASERPRDGERGILRHQVPQWMSLTPLKQVILQVSGAHISHGGAGAFYVYLKRSRD